MRSRARRLATILIFIFAACPAVAALDSTFWFGLSGFGQAELRERNAQNETGGYLAAAHAGRTYGRWLFLGASYEHDFESVLTSGYASTASNERVLYTRTSLGPTIGLIGSRGFLLYTYNVYSKWLVRTRPQGGEWSDDVYRGDGSKIEAAIFFEAGPFLIGPQLSYKQYSYRKLSSEGAANQSLSPALKDTKLDPTLSVWMRF